MSVFDAIKGLFSPKAEFHQPEFEVMELDEIWKIEDKSNMLMAINDRLCARSDYGDHMDRLSPEEQVFYICNLLEQEVNNGGFDQFLYNSSGNFAYRTEECLRIIGADKTADICHTAFAVFGKPIPQDRSKREKFLDKMESDEITEVLSQCDDRFYDYPDDLEELNYRYIMANKEKFT